MLLTEKTRQEKLQKKRNIFGLGVTSLIAACSAATDNDTAAATPTPIVPDELITRPEHNGGITATLASVSVSDEQRPNRNTDSADSINDIGILINLKDAPIGPYSSGNNPVLEGTKTVTFHIENGNHTSEDGKSVIKASLYEVADTGKYDLVVSSPDFGNYAGSELTGGVYIYWNIQEPINSVLDTVANSGNPDLNPLKINFTNYLAVKGLAGNGAIAQDAPQFFHIGGSAQYDMIVRSNVDAGTGAIYILWDVAAYAGANKDADFVIVDFDGAAEDSINATHGLLAIKGTLDGGNIGAGLPDILKINDNDDYDMIIKSTADMYILWDIAKYYSETAPVENSITAPVEITLTDTSATNGLLTISGAGAFDILKDPDGVFLDIDDNGINDIVLTNGDRSNTFILFGEQLAYIDAEGKTVSDTVDLTTISGFNFGGTDKGFFTDDNAVTPTTKAELADVIGYRLSGVLPGLDNDIETIKGLYKTAVTDLNLPDTLSDADAGVGVWDIA